MIPHYRTRLGSVLGGLGLGSWLALELLSGLELRLGLKLKVVLEAGVKNRAFVRVKS